MEPDESQRGHDRYRVVVNGEEQHSIWSEDQPLPAGWRATGVTGTRDACLDHIAEVWPDITPRSIRLARPDPA